VPVEILEKTAKLTDDELNIIKRHAYYSFRILETIPGFDVITQWASHHHERLDEQGYPFKPSGKALTLGSRIIAVADVFTALAEDRIYRKALTSEESLQVLEEMAGSALSPYLVAILREHYDEINSIRIAAQMATLQEYQEWGQADN
jgi:HD-GYP domain-containing protein (c-di-GMP phosphodiesterase class II)